MSQCSKREMIESIRPRYLKANKAEKHQILYEFIATTGYHWKYAIRVLKLGSKPRGLKKSGRQIVYQGEVVFKPWYKFGKSVETFVRNVSNPFCLKW